MALVTRSTGNVIQATDVDQFYNALTGAMTDQAFTHAYSPGSSTVTPVLQLTGNGNGPLLKGYNGATLKYQIDQNGSVTAYGAVSQFGDKLAGSGDTSPGMVVSGAGLVLGSNSSIYLKQNNYSNGTTDYYTTSAPAAQVQLIAKTNNQNPANNGMRLRFSFDASPTAGNAITWDGWYNMARFQSAGGGSAGFTTWVGTSDPGSNAGEGDLWMVG